MGIDIAALARLARLDVTEAELTQLEKEIPDILAFVETIQKAKAGTEMKNPAHHNVMRADAEPHESGVFTEALLKAAPARKKDRIEVKRVINK